MTTIATWRASAACGGGDPAAFFDPDRSDEARGVCAGCPVRLSCLLEALEGGDEGIWGGTDEEQRRGILAELAAVPDTAGIGGQVAWLVRRQADRPIGVCPRCSSAFITPDSAPGWCARCTTQAAIDQDEAKQDRVAGRVNVVNVSERLPPSVTCARSRITDGVEQVHPRSPRSPMHRR